MTTLQAGDKASRTLAINDETIRAFADVTGDNNPVHLDDDYAAGTRFGRRIAHGMIAAGLISATLANDLPGPGTVFLDVKWSFKAPVRPGDTITGEVTVKSARTDKPITELATRVIRDDVEIAGTRMTKASTPVVQPLWISALAAISQGMTLPSLVT